MGRGGVGGGGRGRVGAAVTTMRGPGQQAWAAARASTDLQTTVPVLLSLQACGLCQVRQMLWLLGQAGVGGRVAVRRRASRAPGRQAASAEVGQRQQVANVASDRGGMAAGLALVRVRASNGQVTLQGQAHKQTSQANNSTLG